MMIRKISALLALRGANGQTGRCIFQLALLVFGLAGVAPVNAGPIFLSGDSNLGNAIFGSDGAPETAGNRTFFSNIMADGANVLIQDESDLGSIERSANSINNYYNRLAPGSSGLYSGIIDDVSLAGIDLFFSILPRDPYLAGEIATLSDFVLGGGSLFFMGENENFSSRNSHINAAITALGSSMQIGSSPLDAGWTITDNIDADPFTTGITSLTYGFTNNVTGGTSLLRTLNTDQTFVAYEGREAQPVPEPTTILLLATGLVSLAGLGKKKFLKK